MIIEKDVEKLPFPDFSLDDKYTKEDGKIVLSGTHAIIRIPSTRVMKPMQPLPQSVARSQPARAASAHAPQADPSPLNPAAETRQARSPAGVRRPRQPRLVSHRRSAAKV